MSKPLPTPRNQGYKKKEIARETVVDHRDCFGKGKHQFQETLYDFAKHYGFRPRLCRPYRPQTKA